MNAIVFVRLFLRYADSCQIQLVTREGQISKLDSMTRILELHIPSMELLMHVQEKFVEMQ